MPLPLQAMLATRLKKKSSQMRLYTLLGYLSFTLQIALVTYNYDWEVVLIFYSENLLLKGHDFLE
jgi:hypothetical protein